MESKKSLNWTLVHPSVCLSVRRVGLYIRPISCPKLEGRFPTLDATRIPVLRSNGQRLGLEAGGGIPCRPNPAATLLVVVSLVNVVLKTERSMRSRRPLTYDVVAYYCNDARQI